MGYDGSINTSKSHIYESKSSGRRDGLTLANMVSAIKGRKVKVSDLREACQNLKSTSFTYNLAEYIESRKGLDTMFISYSGEPFNTPLLEASYDFGWGVVRTYDPKAIPEGEETIRISRYDENKPNNIDYQAYQEIVKHAVGKITYPLNMLHKKDVPSYLTPEEFFDEIFLAKNASDAHALKVSAFLDAAIVDMWDESTKEKIALFSQVKSVIARLTEEKGDDYEVSVKYDSGYVIMATDEDPISAIKTPLFYYLMYLFVENPLCNAENVTEKEEAEKALYYAKTYLVKAEQINPDVLAIMREEIESSEDGNVQMSFYGSY